nr:pentatricopeptide repeat-containing protein [Tanacetum cinerariifolium]
MSHIRAKFESIGFDGLLNINEQIVPRFILKFYSQLSFNYNSEGHFVVNFLIQSKSFSFTVEEFGQIKKIPFKYHVSYTDMWLLDYLSLSAPSREFLTPYNLAFFILKRMQKTRNKPKELLPYGMLLSRLFKHVLFVFPELAIDNYLSFDHVMHLLAPHYERKTRSDHGKKRPRELNASSSSATQDHPFSSLPPDAMIDENDDESSYPNSFSPSQQVSSSFTVVFRVRQNPSHESHILDTFLSETINLQTQQRDAH